jgi:hypothetical protein
MTDDGWLLRIPIIKGRQNPDPILEWWHSIEDIFAVVRVPDHIFMGDLTPPPTQEKVKVNWKEEGF